MDIYEKLSRGVYKTKLSYLTKPNPHPLLKSRVDELTDSQIAEIPRLRTEHEAAVVKHNEQRKALVADEARLLQLFVHDLYEEHGIDPALPITALLWDKAWADGHSCGLSEVAGCFADLVPIYVEAMRMAREAGENGFVAREPVKGKK